MIDLIHDVNPSQLGEAQWTIIGCAARLSNASRYNDRLRGRSHIAYNVINFWNILPLPGPPLRNQFYTQYCVKITLAKSLFEKVEPYPIIKFAARRGTVARAARRGTVDSSASRRCDACEKYYWMAGEAQ